MMNIEKRITTARNAIDEIRGHSSPEVTLRRLICFNDSILATIAAVVGDPGNFSNTKKDWIDVIIHHFYPDAE